MTKAATKPRIRPATEAEVTKYEAAVAAIKTRLQAEGRQLGREIVELRVKMGLFVNFASGRPVYRAYNR